jgi:hypothetical protein
MKFKIMKRIFLAIPASLLSCFAVAQQKIDTSIVDQIKLRDTHTGSEQEIFPMIISFCFGLLLVYFFLMAVKRFMDHRLKSKIIDKGISEQLAATVLQNNREDKKQESIKWFFLLVGIGTGLSIVYNQLPLGIHSVAIMAFSIAASFLGYYFYLRYSKK